MPIYEYECIKCKYRFEELQKVTDKPLKICPKCGGQLRRLISWGVGLIFKGSGFYVTDYKKNNLPQPREKRRKDLKKLGEKPKPPAKVPSESSKL
jgi:putative FmdB family regulatory protein